MEIRKSSIGIGLAIVALSVVYSTAMFRGLENHSSYFGNAYQALYPGSFPDDPFMHPGRPTMLSLYYNLVRWVGPLWLDDRFTFFLFFGMTVLSLIALDKTARLLGAQGQSERSAILSLVLLEHKFFIPQVILVDNYGFNATAFGGAAVVWLLYGLLAGWRPLWLLVMTCFALWISMKNAWLPALIALVFIWRGLPSARSRIIVLSLAAAAGGLAVLAYYGWLRPPDGTHPALFDFILRRIDDYEANPFLYPLWVNLLFAVLCGIGFFLKGLPSLVERKIRVIAAIGLGTWLLGGLYLTYSPDFLKIPYLVPFDVRRALRWPMYVVFVGAAVATLKWFKRAKRRREVIFSWAALMAIYLFHQEPRFKLMLVVGGVTAFFWWRYAKQGLEQMEPSIRMKMAACTLVIGTFSLYGIGTVSNRLPALRFLARYGIMGDNPTAKWIGVNEYVRDHVPPSATVLAFSLEDSFRKEVPLRFDDSLRVRAGRTMPMGHPAAFYFDYPKLQWRENQSRLIQGLEEKWHRRDAAGVSEILGTLGSPDYLVVPTTQAKWIQSGSSLGYSIEGSIRQFTVFRKGDNR